MLKLFSSLKSLKNDALISSNNNVMSILNNTNSHGGYQLNSFSTINSANANLAQTHHANTANNMNHSHDHNKRNNNNANHAASSTNTNVIASWIFLSKSFILKLISFFLYRIFRVNRLGTPTTTVWTCSRPSWAWNHRRAASRTAAWKNSSIVRISFFFFLALYFLLFKKFF